jgi:hypothetical protein
MTTFALWHERLARSLAYACRHSGVRMAGPAMPQ